MAVTYFLDTYALIEIANGNEKFKKYLAADVHATDLTLAEFYGVLLRRFNEQTAEHWRKKFLSIRRAVDYDVLIDAITFRHAHPRISFFDAQGYCAARKGGAVFVTGDEDFRGVEGVEFAKG